MKSPVIARRLGWSLLVAASIGGCSSQAGDVVISQQPIEGAPSESIVPNKELVFTDPSITDGQDADDRFDGPFSFRYLIEQMTPVGVHPGDFAEKWIREELKGRSFNGFAASETVREVDEFVSDPNLFSRGPDGKLDFVRTPFQLAVIANRIDLDDGGAPGELRFDFTIGQKFKRATKPDESDVVNVPNQNGTVIFEYHFTPIAGVGDSRREWARRFHALGKLPFGAAFNERLRALTDAVVRRGANSGGPNGSALSQVRTVEATMGPAGGEALNGWEIREFHLVAGSDGKGYLQVVPLAITPARELVVTQDRRLTNWLARNQDAVLAGRTVPLPESMRAPFGHPKTGAYVQGPTNDISNAYNVTTCVGCHGQSGQQARDSDSNDGLTQASRIFSRTDNPQFPGFQVLSSFVRNVDLERRSLYMGDLLKSGSRAPLPPLLPAVAIASSTPALVVASDIPHKRVFAEFEIEGASRDFAVELVKPGGASLWVYPPAQHLGQVELDAAEASRGTWTAKAWGGATVRSWTLYFTR